ncbi:TIGR02206 family membrane protein [Sediminibacillus dalangtanensis]|uniref:TIGR02206 family membrane protein n=1 Tax=Sediminibacillus dalangtanensis TaxID=2729421 RepID=A0ABX7VZ21_9BACI|nr:TIGR02206 family membrane protein [Sediminibacillus dalangtanensis]QTN00919.1 TIGR02206 family membrane protein [Sediminibacillus dalangtanensis]
MGTWFDVSSTDMFQPFSTSHLLMLAAYACGVLVMIILRKKLQQKHAHAIIRWLLFLLLLSSELSYQGWAIHHGVWRFPDHMPLHLCGIASITAMLALIFQNKPFIRLTYFLAVVPAMLALITPDLPYGPEHFRFWKFFLHHIAISWSGIFLVLSIPIRITLASMLRAFLFLVSYALVVGMLINPLAGANYLYLARPAADTLLNHFGSGIMYYINLIVAAFVAFILLYGIAKSFPENK